MLKLLTNSNSLHKVNVKREIKPKRFLKLLIILIITFISAGFIYERVTFSRDMNTLKTKSKYSTLNGKKIYYNAGGSGKYTVIFESDLGYTSFQWEKVIKNMPKNLEVSTFTYDRPGYGFSDKNDYKNPEEQARDLHLFFRKIGMEGPYILVGDGYGSLVMSNFAKIYGDEVAGVIFINPINEKVMKSNDFLKEASKGKFMKKVEQIGSYVGLTRILDDFGLVKYPEGLLDKVSENCAKDIKAHRVTTNHTTALWNETKVLINGDSKAQGEGMLGDKPLAIIVNEKGNVENQKELAKLTKDGLTFIDGVKPESEVIPLENYSKIYEALKFIIKKSNGQG